MQLLTGTDPVAVNFAAPIAQPAKVWLRVGLLGPTAEDKLTASFNGAAVPLQPTALQEIPLALGAIRDANRLEVKLAPPSTNPRLAVGFASLILETGR
jgi:hypothetical protein